MGLFDFLKRSKVEMPIISKDARTLLAEIALDPKGELVRIRIPGQVIYDTNEKQCVDEKGPNKGGRWKAAIDELIQAKLIGPIGMKPYKLFLITEKGAKITNSVLKGIPT